MDYLCDRCLRPGDEARVDYWRVVPERWKRRHEPIPDCRCGRVAEWAVGA